VVQVCDDFEKLAEQQELTKNIVEVVVDSGASASVVLLMWMKNRNSGGSHSEAAEENWLLWTVVFANSDYR
jgi:hypothetical protein